VPGLDAREDEMVLVTSGGFAGDGSPNRVDALVWALSDLITNAMKASNFYEFMRQEAARVASGDAVAYVPSDPAEALMNATLGIAPEHSMGLPRINPWGF